MDYLQLVSEAGSTKARHASSTAERALRTLIAERAARAHGRHSGDRAGARPREAVCLGSALPALQWPSPSAGGAARGEGDRPLPAPSPGGEAVTGTFPGSFALLGVGVRGEGGLGGGE